MKEEEVDQFFRGLAGDESGLGKGKTSANTGAAARNILLQRIQESQSRELVPADIDRREALIRELRDDGHFRHTPPGKMPQSGHKRRKWLRPRYLLIAVMLLLVVAALLENALQSGSEEATAPEVESPAPPVPEASPASEASAHQAPVPEVPAPAATSEGATTRFPPPAKAIAMEAPAAPAADANPQAPSAAEEGIRVSFLNTSGKVMDNFYIQRGNLGESKREVLGQGRVASGESFEVKIRNADQCLYTFTGEFHDATQVVKRDVDICRVRSVEFGP